MQTLSARDMRRIVNGGERFLLVEIANSTSRGPAVHIPFDGEFLQNVLAYTAPGSLPVVIQGDVVDAGIAEQAAELLRAGHFPEVWTFFETWPGVEERTTSSRLRHDVVSDPDADDRARHGRTLQHK